jgi:hypothetical protein
VILSFLSTSTSLIVSVSSRPQVFDLKTPKKDFRNVGLVFRLLISRGRGSEEKWYTYAKGSLGACLIMESGCMVRIAISPLSHLSYLLALPL